MAWRKWFVRGLVFGTVGLCACGAFAYRHWTSPAIVREKVLEELQRFFPGASITLDSAHLQLFGGISVSELHLSRRDDADRVDFLHVPAATIYYDKEKLLDGFLHIRKLEFDRPRLRLATMSDGRWNLEGITGPVNLKQTLPTLAVHQGTLVMEDRRSGTHLEITNVTLTAINDPLLELVLDGRVHSDLVGEVGIHGTWNRGSHDGAVSLQVQGVALTPMLIERIAAFYPNAALEETRLEGVADVKADLAYTPASSRPLSYDVRCHLTKGKLKLKGSQAPHCPFDMDHLDATLRCSNGQLQIEHLHGRSGPSEILARGTALLPAPEDNFEGVLEIKHLNLCEALLEKVPELKKKKLYELFRPSGPATLRVDCAKTGGHWTSLTSGGPSTLSLLPENLQAAYKNFPYPLHHLQGRLDLNLLTNRLVVDVRAQAGARPVSIKGTWQGMEKQADAQFEIEAINVPLDETLLAALDNVPDESASPEGPHGKFGKLARSFKPHGSGDIKASVRHVPGAEKFANHYNVRFHDSEIEWAQFPYHLTNVSGVLDIYPKHWEFSGFQGKHNEGQVTVQGRSTPVGEDKSRARIIVEIGGRNVTLDDDLKRGLQPHPALTKVWDTFEPSGHIEFSAAIDRPLYPQGPDEEAAALEDLKVQVDMRGFTVQPRFFPYALQNVTSKVRYHKNKIELTQISARHGLAEVTMKSGVVDLLPPKKGLGGGFYATLEGLEGRDLRIDADFVKALPPDLKTPCSALDLSEPVFLRTSLLVYMPHELSQPDIAWDGELWLKKGRLHQGPDLKDVTGFVACKGRSWLENNRGHLKEITGNFKFEQAVFFKQPFQDVWGRFSVSKEQPNVMAVGLRAPIFGGDISGELRLETSPLQYKMNLTASQIDLKQFSDHNFGPDAHMKGTAIGRLVMSGTGAGIESLNGAGSIEVPNGEIKELPVLVALLNFLGLRWPDRTMFDAAKAEFHIQGQRVRMENLELLGKVMSLYGNGDFKLDGTDIHLDLHPMWARVEQLVPAGLRSIPAKIGELTCRIEVRGRVSSNPKDLKFTKVPLPLLVAPFRDYLKNDQ